MKYLLDTHSLLWTVFEPDKLSAEAQEIILDQNNIICVSLISLWEISISPVKVKLINAESHTQSRLRRQGKRKVGCIIAEVAN